MDKEQLASELIRDEGFVAHAYHDHLGYLTIGVGRLIDERRGGGITRDEALYLLHNDIDQRVEALRQRLDFWEGLDDTRQRALANMAFQMGLNGVMNFRRMLAALARGEWKTAHDEALDSRWAQQTPERANRVADMILWGNRGAPS